MTEIEFIEAALQQYREALGKLPEKFKASQREADRQEAHLCENAGIMGEVQVVRDNLKMAQKQIQSQADVLQGRIGVLEEIHNQFYLAPIPEGVTHMYGIELAPLDPTTRLIVMEGQEGPTWQDTILSLGGDPTTPGEKPHFEPPVLSAPQPDLSVVEEMLSEQWGEMIDGPEPDDTALDEIELSEIEARIESGEATQEDLVRASLMLERAQESQA